jgi:hypothetical protein
MWLVLSLAAALFQVLRNTTMKRLGHALDEYINVWGPAVRGEQYYLGRRSRSPDACRA